MCDNEFNDEQCCPQIKDAPAPDCLGETDVKAALTVKEKIASTVYDAISIFTSAIITIMVIFTFVFRFVGVVGPSMEPTLWEDDWLAVTSHTGNPKHGDIVIITQPNAFNEPIVKRVVATAGQTVNIKNGNVFINGERLTETYISSDIFTERENLDNYPVTVPDGYVFVLGDNRSHSTDSRSSLIGLIRNEYIIGKVVFRLIPFGSFSVGMEYDY
ncbi:MAG: signal peptidase I [Clostridiales bacterium]|jgi:signal peptidase I|nr:signal peptidase I [Clostridiales bacterium]